MEKKRSSSKKSKCIYLSHFYILLTLKMFLDLVLLLFHMGFVYIMACISDNDYVILQNILRQGKILQTLANVHGCKVWSNKKTFVHAIPRQ